MSAHAPSRLLSLCKSILIGLCIGVVVATLLLLLCALLIYRMDLPDGAVTPMALTAVGLGGLSAGLATGWIAKQNGLLMGALCGTLLYLLLLILGLARGGIAPAYAILKWAVLTVCSAAGGVWSVNRR